MTCTTRTTTCCAALLLIFAVVIPATAANRAAMIEITINHRAELEQLTRMVSIERVDGRVVTASASPDQLVTLERAGVRWREIAEEKTALTATMCGPGWEHDEPPAWDCYPSYQQYVALMQRLAQENPQLCRLEHLGRSANLQRPHQLLALRISDNPEIEEDEPEVLLTSTMHGDETTGFVLMLRLAHELLELYGSDPEITELVDSVELWINPNANPDGTYFAGDHTVSGAIRYYTNRTGGLTYVNPNRNFPDPDPDDGDHPDGNPWWPETEVMMAFAAAHSFNLSANFHGGAEVVNYPWDTWERRHRDDHWLHQVSRRYADATHEDGPAGYMTDLDDGVTNGWDWYTISGGRQDFMTYFHGGREFTIELSGVKLLPAEQLPGMWTANRRALLGFVAESLQGIRGVVRNTAGQPLAATIEIVDPFPDFDRSWVFTDPDVGDYHRMVGNGHYFVTVSAPGYEPLEEYYVDVQHGQTTNLDVTLFRSPPRHGGNRIP